MIYYTDSKLDVCCQPWHMYTSQKLPRHFCCHHKSFGRLLSCQVLPSVLNLYHAWSMLVKSLTTFFFEEIHPGWLTERAHCTPFVYIQKNSAWKNVKGSEPWALLLKGYLEVLDLGISGVSIFKGRLWPTVSRLHTHLKFALSPKDHCFQNFDQNWYICS